MRQCNSSKYTAVTYVRISTDIAYENEISELLMLLAALLSRRFSSHDRAQVQFCVHVFMNREGRKLDTFARQMNPRPAVSGNAVAFFEMFCRHSLRHLQMLAFETPYSAVRLWHVHPSSI